MRFCFDCLPPMHHLQCMKIYYYLHLLGTSSLVKLSLPQSGIPTTFAFLTDVALNEIMASLRSSSFSKWEKASWEMLTYPQIGILKICNRCFWETFTRGGFLVSSRSSVIFCNQSYFVIVVILVWVTTFCPFHYWVTKNPHIHGNMVLLFGNFKVCQKVTKLALFYCKPMHFLQVCNQKPLYIIFFFWPGNMTWNHPFTHAMPKYTMGKGGRGASTLGTRVSWTIMSWLRTSIQEASWTLGFSPFPCYTIEASNVNAFKDEQNNTNMSNQLKVSIACEENFSPILKPYMGIARKMTWQK